MTPELVADLAYRLTERDREILRLVWEHRVLTTAQLTAMFFPSLSRAQQRLRILYRRFALLRFQPWVPVGRDSWHWVLGPAGAHVLAAERGVSIKDLGYRQDAVLNISLSQRLGHQRGVNDFFVRLHTYARQRADGTRLEAWWSEQRCASLCGDHVRPDAFGCWTEPRLERPPALLEFFLEHDTGTEPLARLGKKIHAYATLARTTGRITPVLFWLPSGTREVNFRRHIGTPPVPVATAVHAPATATDGPAGPEWLPAGITGPRYRLAALADAWEFPATPTDPSLGAG